MCIWCQLFSRAVSKTNLYSHHNVILIRTFCYFYKVELGITVELNLAITHSESAVCVCVYTRARALSSASILQSA